MGGFTEVDRDHDNCRGGEDERCDLGGTQSLAEDHDTEQNGDQRVDEVPEGRLHDAAGHHGIDVRPPVHCDRR